MTEQEKTEMYIAELEQQVSDLQNTCKELSKRAIEELVINRELSGGYCKTDVTCHIFQSNE